MLALRPLSTAAADAPRMAWRSTTRASQSGFGGAVVAAAAAAAAAVVLSTAAVCAPAAASNDDDCGSSRRRRATTFREKKIAEYEDRIRMYSSPDKIFRYFATVSVDGIPYMRPSDFIRSLTPGELQPQEYGLDVFQPLSPEQAIYRGGNARLLRFDAEGNVTNDNELISYSEFVFLLTCLSTPKHQFALAFYMFDLDGNGIVDREEFQHVQQAVQGKTGRLSAATLTATPPANTALERSLLLQTFFGRNGTQKLDLAAFNKFVDELRSDVMQLDFLIHNRKSADRSRIAPIGLARMLLKYARIRREERGKYYERVAKKFGDNATGISVTDTIKFFDFLSCIDDVDKALGLYAAAGISITEKDFMRAAKVAANVELSAELVHLVFVLFDTDGDGLLNYSEFMALMKEARSRGLNRERSLGAERGFKALARCIKEQLGPAGGSDAS